MSQKKTVHLTGNSGAFCCQSISNGNHHALTNARFVSTDQIDEVDCEKCLDVAREIYPALFLGKNPASALAPA